MKASWFLYILVAFSTVLASAQSPDMGGTLTCTLNGRTWHGKLNVGTYNRSADLIDLQFRGSGSDSLSLLNIHIKGVKQYMAPYPEYTNEFEFDYSAMSYSDEYILITYVPNKHAPLREYKPLYTGIHIQQLDLENLKIRFECMAQVGIMKDNADRTKSIMENLEKMEISDAQTDVIRLFAY